MATEVVESVQVPSTQEEVKARPPSKVLYSAKHRANVFSNIRMYSLQRFAQLHIRVSRMYKNEEMGPYKLWMCNLEHATLHSMLCQNPSLGALY